MRGELLGADRRGRTILAADRPTIGYLPVAFAPCPDGCHERNVGREAQAAYGERPSQHRPRGHTPTRLQHSSSHLATWHRCQERRRRMQAVRTRRAKRSGARSCRHEARLASAYGAKPRGLPQFLPNSSSKWGFRALRSARAAPTATGPSQDKRLKGDRNCRSISVRRDAGHLSAPALRAVPGQLQLSPALHLVHSGQSSSGSCGPAFQS